jgi:hypothetical protein
MTNDRIAGKVMGWNKRHDELGNDLGMWDHGTHVESSFTIGTPDFLTDWNAMRLVIEKMRERGYDFEVSDVRLGDRYIARFVHSVEKIKEPLIANWFDAIHESLPPAVCLAALEAVKGG